MPLTEVSDLLVRIERDPENDVLAAMLTDALMEEREMIRTEADRHVERVRNDSRVALDMAFAAKLIRQKGEAYPLLLARLAYLVGIPTDARYQVILAPCNLAPWVSYSPLTADHPPLWERFIVSVGASWVASWWRDAGRPSIFPRRPVKRSSHGSRRRSK